jgi:hypothetical protein
MFSPKISMPQKNDTLINEKDTGMPMKMNRNNRANINSGR